MASYIFIGGFSLSLRERTVYKTYPLRKWLVVALDEIGNIHQASLPFHGSRHLDRGCGSYLVGMSRYSRLQGLYQRSGLVVFRKGPENSLYRDSAKYLCISRSRGYKCQHSL
jgi:hypothetical protein